MGDFLSCNCNDTKAKLQMDYFGARQRLFKKLGFKDRNNNGEINRKDKNWINKLFRAEEGYDNYDQKKYTHHPADTNKDNKIDEKEGYNWFYLKYKSMATRQFLEEELNGKNIKEQKEFLDKIAGYLKPSKALLGAFLANVLQIGIDGLDKELVRYVAKYLEGLDKYPKSLSQLAVEIKKQSSNLNGSQIVSFMNIHKDDKEYTLTIVNMFGQIKHPAAIPALQVALKDNNSDVRQAAAEALGNMGVPAITALQAALKDNNSDVRQAAAEALGNMGALAVPAITALQAALKDNNSDVRQAAAEALGNMGALAVPAITALQAALKDNGWNIRNSAARALGNIGVPAIPAFQAALKDSDWRVRQAAAKALGKIGTSAIPALQAALKDSDSDVRRAAAEALGNIKHSSAIPALQAALKDSEWWVRRAAAEALGNIKHSSAIPALQAALKDGYSNVRSAAAEALLKINVFSSEDEKKKTQAYVLTGEMKWGQAVALGKLAIPALQAALKDGYSNVRSAAAEALGKIGNPAILALQAALKDNDSDVRRSAARALGNMGALAVPAIPALQAALKDSEWRVRQAAAEALLKINVFSSEDEKKKTQAYALVGTKEWKQVITLGKLAIPALQAALKDSDWRVRQAAAKALGKIGTSAIPALQAALKDSDSDVRRAAAEALGNIKHSSAITALQAALKDKDSDVRRSAAEALEKLDQDFLK